MRFILGVLLGAVVFFMWGFVYWTLSPLPNMVLQYPGEADAAVAEALSKSLGKSGVYKAPMPPKDMKDEVAFEAYSARHLEGPVYTLIYDQDGAEPMGTTRMAYGGAHSLLVAFIGGLVIMAAAPRAYLNRVMLIFWVAVFGTVWTEIGNVVWWYYPWNLCWLEMGYHIGGGLVLGLVLAAFIRPDPEMG